MIAVLGDVLVDVVIVPDGPTNPGSDTPSTITWRQGGAAASTAAWLAAEDVPVRLVGRIGDDIAGRSLEEVLHGLGVETLLARDADRPTGTVVALRQGADRDMFTARGAAGRLSPADLRTGWLDGVTHLHVSGYVLLSETTRPAGLAALDAAVSRGISVSVDPSSTGPLAAVGGDVFLGLLPAGIMLTPNLPEAALLTGSDDPGVAASRLGAQLGEAVVTCGAEGAVWSDGSASLTVPAEVVEGPDHVGAGDAFTAGLLAARHQGLAVDGQLAAAVALATRSVRGGRPHGRA